MSGIYDIPKFLLSHEPPAVPLEIARIYQDIIAAAFGEDQQVWEAASPSRMKLKSLGEKDGGEGRETKDITLAYSSEDELVENGQWLYMQGHLKMYGWELGEGYEQEKIVRRKRLSGAHDFVWEDGRQVVDLVKEAVERISKS